mgnify:CR=1 FL=1
MVEDNFVESNKDFAYVVLILILLEDGRRPRGIFLRKSGFDRVLILILLEDGRRPAGFEALLRNAKVLILILLEDGRRRDKKGVDEVSLVSLNPYSVGRWSKTLFYITL